MKVRIGNALVDLAKVEALTGADAIAARETLQAVEQLRRENPLQFYKPTGPTMDRMHREHVPLRVVRGGNRSGKTTGVIADDLIQATPAELLRPDQLAYKRWHCPFYVRVMTPDMQRTMIPVIHKKIEEWIPRALLKGGSWKASYNRDANSLQLECGCRFDFLSYEMSLDKFGGTDLHRCHYDEEPPPRIREECQLRLLDYDGDEIFSFTPLQGYSWTYQELQKAQGHPDLRIYQLSTRENPHLNQTALQRLIAGGPLGLSQTAIERRIDGAYASEHGLVYPSVHSWDCEVPTPEAIQAADEIIVGIDPGFVICGLTFTASFRSEYFLTFEAVELRESDAGKYAEAIGQVFRRWGLNPTHHTISYGIDPNNARQRNLVTGESVEDELHRHGIYPEMGQKDLLMGVMLVRRLGRLGKWQYARNLTTFRERMAEYPLEENAALELVPAKTGREHCPDALRYSLSIRAWPDLEAELEQDRPAPMEANIANKIPRIEVVQESVMGPLA